MSSASQIAPLTESSHAGTLVAWRWVHVGVAALAMVATLPGRTHGLGLFTEPIRQSLGLDTENYGLLNMGATLLGALFCLPCGWLIDRLGTRTVLTGVMVALGGVVLAMSQVQGDWVWRWSSPTPWGTVSIVLLVDFFLLVLLTRGLGQSALSVASLSLIGRTASRRAGWAMGVYSVLVSAGFLGAFWILGDWVKQHPHEWRPAWASIGVAVLVAGLLAGTLVRNRLLTAESTPREASADGTAETSRTLGQALRSPAFWTFGVAVSFYGMVAAGTSLFNEGILNTLFPEHTKRIFVNVTRLGIPVGLTANLLGGWLATRWSLSRMLALAMAALAAALAVFPSVRAEWQVYLYAAVMAAAGGIITVCFFAVWRVGFGPAHLGKIQGAAQMLTVLFSALGPPLFGSAKTRLGSYLPLFPYLAAASLALALTAWLAGLPGERPTTKTT
ncbi:MAG TPA: MFS transporter [Gemmataceae bacterium]|nr:MFS transporter [Gemmataceae bacterium]